MKKNVFGRHFKRDRNERKALFKNLLTSLVLHERIETTQEKAKAIKASADKLITKAKKGGDVSYKALAPEVNHEAIVKLINDIAPRFVSRQGGYTRIIKTKYRVADNAAMALLEWTEKGNEKVDVRDEKVKKSKEAKASKKEAQTTDIVEAEIVDAASSSAQTKKKAKKEGKS